MSNKSSHEVAGILKHYRKAKPVTIEEMDASLHDYFQQRAARADRKAFRKILENVPDIPPVPGDEILQVTQKKPRTA